MGVRYCYLISSWYTTKSAIVVLLDEADVFLEQRTLSDLQRNALVSGKDHLTTILR